MQKIAKELGVVLPVSFFEEANNAHYNSIAVIDADGTDLGLYRKSHIPDGPGMRFFLCYILILDTKFYLFQTNGNIFSCCAGYQEKFYFNPGDTGFKVKASFLYDFDHLFYVKNNV